MPKVGATLLTSQLLTPSHSHAQVQEEIQEVYRRRDFFLLGSGGSEKRVPFFQRETGPNQKVPRTGAK